LNQQRNDHLTLQWLQGAVREIRNELQTELSAAHNASELRSQESAGLLSDVALLRSDVASTRADLETLRGDQTRSAAHVEQIDQELITVKERSQSSAASCANLRAQVSKILYSNKKYFILHIIFRYTNIIPYQNVA
jgi:DNA repair exonuclease SbcCD ATPase subunit